MARHSDPQRDWLTDFRCQGITRRGRWCRRYGDTTHEPASMRETDFVVSVRCRAHAKQSTPMCDLVEPMSVEGDTT